MPCRPAPSLWVLVFALSCPLASGAAPPVARPSVAVTRASAPLRIDGVLDEPDWQRATPISDFRLLFPREGEMPSESTVVRVLVEPRRIVFGIWCSTRRAARASLSPRDEITDGDHVAVHLDPDGDGQRAYIFGINPHGVQLDGVLTGEDPDFKWDGVWAGEAHRGPDAWTAEIAVPFRAMRIPEAGTIPWRVWVRREITAWNEVAAWPLYERGRSGGIMLQAADLTGLADAHGGHAVSILPYVFAAGEGDRTFDANGEASAWDSRTVTRAGLDVQASPTSQLALNATLHPDFSQIESDALLIDLNQRFPLQYPEKRPFFLEGGEVFQGPLDLLYTRRIGSPSFGLKLAGHTLGLRTGTLIVRDDGGASLAGSGYGGDADSRPGWFGIARATKPFGDGSSLGFLAGAHTQDAAGETRAQGSANAIVGADAFVRMGKRWSFEGQAAHTSTASDSVGAPTGGTQTTRFDDWIWVSRLRYRDAARALFVGVRGVGPQFRDELGYQERVGVRYQNVVTEWNLYPQSGPLQRVTWNEDDLVIHDRDGQVEYVDFNNWFDAVFRSHVQLSPGVEFIDEHWLSRHYHQARGDLYAEWLGWRPLTLTFTGTAGDGIYYGADDASSFLGWSENCDLTATARPREWLTSAIDLKHLRVAHSPTRGQVIDLWLAGVNTTAQFTRRVFARLYPQYANDTRHLAIGGLLGYVLHPGTVFYAGVNGGYDTVGTREHITSRQVFVKAAYRFEP